MPHKTIFSVKVINCFNRLKHKINPERKAHVFISQQQLNDAQNVYNDYLKKQDDITENAVHGLHIIWGKIISDTDNNQEHLISMFLKYINRTYEVAELFSNDLMLYFIKSIRKFMRTASLENEKHILIIQAHLDVINLARKQKINNRNDPKAVDLINLLKLAIEKYS